MTPSFNIRKLLYPLALLWKALMALFALLPFVSSEDVVPVRMAEPSPSDLYLEALHQAEINQEPPPPQPSSFGDSVDRWVHLVRKYFREEDVEWAMRVIACESEGNPNAVNSVSGATGLFQHLPQYWEHRAAMAGFPGTHPTQPEANIAASAWLYYEPNYGGPGHWVCK